MQDGKKIFDGIFSLFHSILYHVKVKSSFGQEFLNLQDLDIFD